MFALDGRSVRAPQVLIEHVSVIRNHWSCRNTVGGSLRDSITSKQQVSYEIEKYPFHNTIQKSIYITPGQTSSVKYHHDFSWSYS